MKLTRELWRDIEENKELLEKNDFKSFFDNVGYSNKAELLEFFYDILGMDVLKYMDEVPSNFFNGAEYLRSVVIPPTIKKINMSAFANCPNLTSVVINDSVEDIGSNAFNGCSNLTSVELPSTLKVLNQNVFKNCKNLKQILLPPSLTKFESDVFAGDDDLTIYKLNGHKFTVKSTNQQDYLNRIKRIDKVAEYPGTITQPSWASVSVTASAPTSAPTSTSTPATEKTEVEVKTTETETPAPAPAKKRGRPKKEGLDTFVYKVSSPNTSKTKDIMSLKECNCEYLGEAGLDINGDRIMLIEGTQEDINNFITSCLGEQLNESLLINSNDFDYDSIKE